MSKKVTAEKRLIGFRTVGFLKDSKSVEMLLPNVGTVGDFMEERTRLFGDTLFIVRGAEVQVAEWLVTTRVETGGQGVI